MCAGGPPRTRPCYAVAMRKIADIHVFEDKPFQRGMVRMSAAVLAAGAVIGAAWVLLGPPRSSELSAVVLGGAGSALGLPGLVWWLLAVLCGCVASFAVHELVHGLLFKLFAPPGTRVTFGANWKMGMLYACAEGIVYTRRRYLVIALAPTVVVTALLVVLGLAGSRPLACYIVALVHLSGCTGDWEYVRAIVGDPRITHCEDTAWGVRFFGDGSDDGQTSASAVGE